MRHSIPTVITSLLISIAAPAGRAAESEPPSEPRAAAEAFLAALGDDQREAAIWPFEDDEREDVHFAPLMIDGLALGDLDGDARARADALLQSSLSTQGLETVTRIRMLERDVIEHERGTLFGWTFRSIRDPDRYRLAFFGDPSDTEPWAMRFEGHHLSLNVTHRPGRAPSTTPLFLGAQPREVPAGWPSAGVAALGEQEALARRLYAALDADQQASASLSFSDGRDWMIGQVSRVDAPAPVGLARGEMTDDQKDLLDALIARFASIWPAEAEMARHAELDAAGRDAIHFAWTEGTEPKDAFYLRVHGPRILLEVDNTSDGEHIHAVWHDPAGDFGDRPLATHLRRSHGLGLSR